MNGLLSDPALSESGAQALINANPGVPFSVSNYDQCPAHDPSMPASFRDVLYKTYVDGNPGRPLYLDEYDPPPSAGPGPFSLMVMVHGGGFWRSCRDLLQPVAWEASDHVPSQAGLSHYYIVLNIETRLACDPADPNLQTSPILRLCGWPFPRAEHNSTSIGASIHDVEDAVTWARTTWGTLPGRPVSSWNGRIVLLGGSSGGTMVYSAVAPAPEVGGAVDVDAVAAWSPILEFSQTGDGNWPCVSGESVSPTDCQKGESSYYLDCQTPGNPYPDPACTVSPPGYQFGVYTQASPITFYTSSSLPHAFFANAGGPYEGGPSDHPELVSLQSAWDFQNRLIANGWTIYNQYDFCIVDNPPEPNPPHGRGLRGYNCDAGSAGTVWQRTAAFLG